MRPTLQSSLAAFFLVACSRAPPGPVAQASSRSWIDRSNDNARLMLDVLARFEPERASEVGVAGTDDQIADFQLGHRERQREAFQQVLRELERRAALEHDRLVAQDLTLLTEAAQRRIRGSELNEKLLVPYANVPRMVFAGVRSLLDPQVAPERRLAALNRVRRYAGLDGQTPLVQLAEAETRAGLAKPELFAPSRIAVENDLQTAQFLIAGIDKLFDQYAIPGHQEPVSALHRQLTEYVAFIRAEILPHAREDFRLPPELYAFDLVNIGVDLQPADLAQRAHTAFAQIQGQMQTIAARVAKARSLPSQDYRDVIRALKKEQIPDDQVLAHYQQRLAQLEQIIRDHQLVTLPSRPARIRLGTPAENAQQPAPHMVPPRLLGNAGEQGEFVLPLGVPGEKELKYDDFNHASASWTLTAHEARPGHELQFSRMVENGVSVARAIFAFNSVNVEGWGLYSEAICLPYMPDEGQLVSLQFRLQRAARAFLDPELQAGKWTPQAARDFLEREVVLSPAFSKEEVDRFTFRMPAQATSYFYGYLRLIELREEAERAGGPKFSALAFHDLILSQGLLPPDLMRKAVLRDSVAE